MVRVVRLCACRASVECVRWVGTGVAGWLRSYYDDENWMGMALVRAYEATHDRRFLDKAVFLWKDITGAWDTSCCGNTPGVCVSCRACCACRVVSCRVVRVVRVGW